MNFFRLASGGFVNLSVVVMTALSEDRKTLFLYDSGEKTRAIGVTDPRDIRDLTHIFTLSDSEIREESGITFDGKRTMK